MVMSYSPIMNRHTALLTDYRALFVGMSVSSAWRGYDGSLFIEFGALKQVLAFDTECRYGDGEISLELGRQWRIDNGQSTICDSAEKYDVQDGAMRDLVGLQLEDVSVIGQLPEVVVKLVRGIHVQSFTPSEFSERQATLTLIDNRVGSVAKQQSDSNGRFFN